MARTVSKNKHKQALLEDIPENRLTEADKLADDIIWIQAQLEAAKDKMGEAIALTIEYDNGGGQKGVHEDPEIVAYQRLLKTYLQALDALNKMRTKDGNAGLIGVLKF